ncbi:pentapeptide repeat-containing protein [Phormidium sp. FACHB-592]|uniref:Pentapeptide repeat-containing protein n=1 Tax=Stenomitos frigidus AS-A4 TaxID=2933935 RepID=A0ABV0KPK3_9CYAN|nr:pentapeptide repeat-containing protein [Phormidium sp. FACHB-592]MBD2074176.1 pentapeptide repeat-containing protein [Phormidium sp. FACHB-592]
MPQPQRLDYRNRDLRNRSFKNKDLAGADFSGADIRGCDFSAATLTGANFQQDRTGQSRRQFIIQLVRVVGGTAGGAAGGAVAVSFASAIAVPFAVAVSFAVIVGDGISFTGAVVFAVVSSGAVVVAIHGTTFAISAFGKGAIAEGLLYTELSVLLTSFALYLFRELIQTIRNTPGTIFKGANLTYAKFDQVSIQSADFSDATLDFVDWTGASLVRCQFSNSFDQRIRQLCTSRNGRGQDYSHVNLNRLYLAGVTLAGANLRRANLNDANLKGANLERANLQSTQALGTDFSNAALTGAYIQNWGINADTCFTDVRCDYIYLEPDEQARQPASGSFAPGDFAKLVNQFSKTLDFLFRNGIEPQAFDVALRNLLTKYEDAGLSLQAVVDVGDGDRLVKLNVTNPNTDYAPMHAQFMHDYIAMQKQLEAAREEKQALQQNLAHAEGRLTVYQEQSVFLQGFVYHQTNQFSRPSFNAPNSQFTGDLMPNNDNKIQVGNVQGDVSGIAGGDISGVAGKDITGAAGGDISSTLTLTLDQLEASNAPEILKLADLLKQLKAAIEKPDAGLDKKDQEKALKHLDAIAKLGNDPKNADLLEKAGDALDALPTIIKRGNGLMEFAEKHLPTILSGVRAVLAPLGVSW